MRDKILVVIVAVVIAVALSYLVVPLGIQTLQEGIGMTGPQGETGNIGPQGLQGNQGPTGPQGPRGYKGYVGPKGDTGNIGPIGPQGPQGLPGTIDPSRPIVIGMGCIIGGGISGGIPTPPYAVSDYNILNVRWDSTGLYYYIDMANPPYFKQFYIALVTPIEGLCTSSVSASAQAWGRDIHRVGLKVVLYDKLGASIRGSFQFIVFGSP